MSDANLRFLTTEQALADVAHFVTHIKSNSVVPGAQNSPVILIGGHYSGSLSVWFRQKYPRKLYNPQNIFHSSIINKISLAGSW